jgi:uncharacterized membrane protein YeiB
MSTAGPVKPQSRLEFVDILRGFALIGVLTANLASFSGYSLNPAAYTDFLDVAILVAIQFFVRAKFYSLFSFLFGWGLSVQMQRASARGIRFVPLFARRMAILLAFGLIHGLLIWSGDILTLYAILGFALLLFRKRSERSLLAAAVLFLLLTVILTLPGETMDAFRSWYAQITAFMRQGNLPDSLLATGTYLEIVPKTTQDFWQAQSWFIYFVGSVFSMFLLGLYTGKRQILNNVDSHLPLLKRTLLAGLVIGVIFNAIFVWNTLHPEWVDPRYSRLAGTGSRAIGADALLCFRSDLAHPPPAVVGTLTALRQSGSYGAEQLLAAVRHLRLYFLRLWPRPLWPDRPLFWANRYHPHPLRPNSRQRLASGPHPIWPHGVVVAVAYLWPAPKVAGGRRQAASGKSQVRSRERRAESGCCAAPCPSAALAGDCLDCPGGMGCRAAHLVP